MGGVTERLRSTLGKLQQVGRKIVQWCVRHRWRVQAVFDGGAWAVGLTLATVVRHDFHLAAVDLTGLLAMIPLAVTAQLVAGLGVGLYSGRWRFGSFEETAGVARAAALATTAVVLIDRWGVPEPRMVPLSATVVGGAFAFVLMGGVRYGWRLLLESRRRPSSAHAQRLLVFGAGDAGAQVVTSMMRNPTSPYLPVALLDDDVRKRNLRIMGVPVVGDRSWVGEAAAANRADTLLIAIPSAASGLVTELTERATEAGLETKVLPPVAELLSGNVSVADIREVTDADLLGRHVVETDIASIAGYLTGRRVLVTGAGGSIGSELCRQIYRFAPAELIMADRDESALHAVQLSIEGRALLDSPDLELLDIRDRARAEQLFAERRPQVVFHAAALKHLTLLERHPAEALKTNIWGTLTLLEMAASYGTERFVNISTDKAADPGSVLGYSKRIAEQLTAWFSARASGAYLSVRFGNVLRSRGSVLETFHAQIASGGPITVTDPEVTRYFMTVEEAVQLVVQAGGIGRDGEVLVFDMGDPVRIADVAQLLAARAERPIEIVYTGLRPGEKLHEALLGAGEEDQRPVHPLISHVGVRPLEPDALATVTASDPAPALIDSMRRLAQRGALHAQDAR